MTDEPSNLVPEFLRTNALLSVEVDPGFGTD
jgi:hypothetical protein